MPPARATTFITSLRRHKIRCSSAEPTHASSIESLADAAMAELLAKPSVPRSCDSERAMRKLCFAGATVLACPRPCYHVHRLATPPQDTVQLGRAASCMKLSIKLAHVMMAEAVM